MKNRYTSLAVAAVAVLLLAACGSTGGLGDIFGGATGTNPNTYTQIRGTVDSIDTAGHSVYLTNVSGNGSMLSSGGGNGSDVRVYYDDRTTVNYNGKTYRPEDLERGDQVDVTVDQSSNRLYANSMNVVYNANTGGGSTNTYPGTGTYGSTIHGTVRSIDTSRRTMTLDRGYNGGTVTVNFDANTPVYYNNRTYRPTDLEIGDEIDVRVNGSNAQDITVTRNASGGTFGTGSGTSSQVSTIRGTVRTIDTANRTILLDSPTWVNNFNRGAGTTGSTVTVRYDANTNVDVQGQLYPVSNLERGDVVEVQVQNAGTSNLFAQRIYLIRDVNAR